MKTAFDPVKGVWNIRWPGSVAKHDLVYLSPPTDPMHGIPLGNGTNGALCWFEGSKLIVVLNRCDLWDDAAFKQFTNWSAEQEEFSTTLRHAGRLIIDFSLPVFDTIYLSDFQARLNLADASMTLQAKSPFGTVAVTLFVDHDSGRVYTKVSTSLRDAPELQITQERFGSRTFSHWYSQIRRDPKLGLPGTDASVASNRLYVTHKLTSGCFAIATEIDAKSKLRTARLHSHAARATLAGAAKQTVLLTTTITEPVKGDPLRTAKQELSKAAGMAAAFAKHKKGWKAFWLRSYMDFGDDYLSNLWHVTMFYANASQRGSYPGRFINSLWTWNHDVQNWNFYFHWNQQETYWPLNAAGHHDLVDSYLNYRFTGLPHACKDAKDSFGVDGAIVSDVCERRGYNSKSEFGNHTPVAEIALDFWRQYQFTGDEEFLAAKARPYIIKAAEFLASRFVKQDDGCYHSLDGAGYEGWIPLVDIITEHACIRSLLAAAIEACDDQPDLAEKIAHWKDILAHLAPLPTTTNDAFIDNDETLLRGPYAGQKAMGREILAAGIEVKTNQLTSSFLPTDTPSKEFEMFTTLRKCETGKDSNPWPTLDIRCNDGIFPWVEFSTVFPSGVIGVKDKGSREYRLAANTIRLFGIHGMGWAVLPIALARLGLVDELDSVLTNMPDRWQFYPNGWGHYGPASVMKQEASIPHLRGKVRNTCLDEASRNQDENKVDFELHHFRHMGLESMSCLATAMNETLLQSHDGTIRIAPAVKKSANARFTLHARGGFVVSAEIEQGTPRWVHVKCLRSGTCRIANPWPTAYVSQKGQAAQKNTGETIELEMTKNSSILLTPSAMNPSSWNVVAESAVANTAPKSSATGLAELGKPRMF